MSPAGYEPNPFRPALFTFLRDLEKNNDRDWFHANQDRYEEAVREPALRFISDFGPHLRGISPHFQAIPKKVGGSLFRIHRDVRFSKDKSPYKTHVGIQFRHERARHAHTPGFYFHLSTGDCFVGAGLWHPEAGDLRRVRERLGADPAGWRSAIGGKRFREGWELAGESLKRPPKGFEAEHPLAEDLKRKDYIGVCVLSRDEILAPDFPKRFDALCRETAPLVGYLCSALDLAF
jgi:uncharacterized protein (TIGR02453 family)